MGECGSSGELLRIVKRRASSAAGRVCSAEALEPRLLLAAVSWIGPSGGNWNTPANWSTGIVPGAADTVFIVGPSAPALIVNFTSGTHTVAELFAVDSRLNVSGGSLRASGGGFFTRAILSHSGGTLASDGTLVLSRTQATWTGGTLGGNGSVIVASTATPDASVMTISGAAMKTLSTTLDNRTTVNWTNGTLSLVDATILNAGTFNANATTMSGSGAFQNTGTFNSLTVPVNLLGVHFKSSGLVEAGPNLSLTSGSYRMDAGTLRGNLSMVGLLFEWMGGLMEPGGSTILGSNTRGFIDGSSGKQLRRLLYSDRELHIADGPLFLRDATIQAAGSLFALSASLLHDGGVNSLTVTSVARAATGTIDIQVPINLDFWFINGQITVSGGGSTMLTARGGQDVFVAPDATLRVSGPGYAFGGDIVGTGKQPGGQLIFDSGASTVAGQIELDQVRLRGEATTLDLTGASAEITTLNLGPGGTVRFVGSAGKNAAVLRTGRLLISGGPAMPDATIDLGTNAMIIGQVLNEPNTEGAVVGYVSRGYAGGSWGGRGIISTLADLAAGQFALGYAQAGAIGVSSFFGMAVQPSDVLIRYTLYGDADLNGRVNLADFNRMASNFGASGRFWREGDFNYDRFVNLADFNRLASNFGQVISPSTSSGGFADGREIDGHDESDLPPVL